jgi:type I restriction enzyme S subunit
MAARANIDVKERDWDILTGLLDEYLPDTLVWAFGSRVKFTSHQGSDLDLVAFVTPQQKPQLYDLRDAFAESDLSFRVDILSWEDIPDSFRENIHKDYAVVLPGEYGSGSLSITQE